MKVDKKQITAYKFRTYLILLAMSLSILVIAYNTTALINALPVLQHDFHIAPANLQWLLNTYILASVTFMLVAGKLYDTFDKRTIFLIALVEYLIASLIIIYAPNSKFLYVGRVLQGIGAALIASGSLTIIKKTFLEFRLQKAISIWSTIAGFGFCAGPFLGGYLTSHFSWAYIFWVAILLVIISIVLVLLFLPKEKKQLEICIDDHKHGNLDIAGIISLGAGLFCVVYGFVKINDRGWNSPIILISIIIGSVLLIIFYFIEKQTSSPILDFTVFRNKEFSLALIGTLALFSIILMEIPYLFNIYAQNRTLLNYSAYNAGCALLPLNICYLVGSFTSTKISKFLGYYYTLIFALALQATGLFMLSYLVYYVSYSYMIIPFIVIGFGAGITFPCYSLLAINNIPKDKTGQAAGLLNLTSYFGDLTGTVIWSIIFFYTGSDYLIKKLPHLELLSNNNKSILNNLVMGNRPTIEKILHSDIENKNLIIDQIQKSGITAFSNAMLYSAVIILIITFLFAFYLRKSKEVN